MLQYLKLQSTKFDVGQRVEVKTKDGARYGIVRADQGNNFYHIEYDDGHSDFKISARQMKPNNPNIDRGDSISSVGSKSSSSPLRSMYNRITGGTSSVAPSSSSVSNEGSFSNKTDGGGRPSFASRKRNSVLDVNNFAEEKVSSVDTDSLQSSISAKKKKPLKRKVLTNVELQILDRIRQCKAQLQDSNDNVLSKLDLSYLQLHDIPDQCSEMHFVREINVRKNEFRRISDITSPFPNLKKLDAAFNLFLPPLDMNSEFGGKDSYDVNPFQGLSNPELKLIYLDLSGCQLTTLPVELLQQGPYLEVLIIRKNGLTDLPEWLGQFKALRKLDCADNAIQLSTSLCKLLEEDLTKLNDINFDRNPCMEGIIKCMEGEKNENFPWLGPKTSYLIQRVSVQFSFYFSKL